MVSLRHIMADVIYIMRSIKCNNEWIMTLSSSDNHRSFSLQKQPFLFILKTKPGQHILFIHHITQTVLQTHTEVCERDGWILAGNIKGKSFLRSFFWWQLVTFEHDYGDDYAIIWSRGAYYDTVGSLLLIPKKYLSHQTGIIIIFTMFNITCHTCHIRLELLLFSLCLI